MLVNIGSRIHYRTLATGVFHCERCGGDRPYRHRTGRRWAHLLALPVFPLERTGEHLRCVICRTCYRIELLAVPTIEQMQTALLAATTAATLAMLSAGGAVSPAARRLAVELIMNAGSPKYGDADLRQGLERANQSSLVACGPVPGLRSVIETVSIQLDLHAMEWFLGRVVQVGLADGPLTDAEREIVGTVAKYLGLSQAQAHDVILLTEEAAQAG
jgi:Tellurite resistance protein TerB